MYNAKIVTDSGQTFNFGYEYDSVFDIDPLTGVDVGLATSQGYQQIGETVEGQSVGGVNRTIKGVFIKNSKTHANEMMSALPMFTTGKLYYYLGNEWYTSNKYFCEIVIKKTPAIYTDKTGVTHFSILVFCPTPFWLYYYERSHTLFAADGTWNYKNEGVAQTDFSITFACNGYEYNPGIKNVDTGKYIRLNTRLDRGVRFTVERKYGKLSVYKYNEDDKTNTQDIFAALDEGSNLFELASGDNNLQVTVGDNPATGYGIWAVVQFYEPYMGVINATD